MSPYVPFPLRRVHNMPGRIPPRPCGVHVAKTSIAGDHIRSALLDRVVVTVPNYVAVADRHHCAPRGVPVSLAGWNIEAQDRCQNRGRKHQSNGRFHRDLPNNWQIFSRRSYWRIETNQSIAKEGSVLICSKVGGYLKRRFFAVLHLPPIGSPVEAVRAAVVAEQRNAR